MPKIQVISYSQVENQQCPTTKGKLNNSKRKTEFLPLAKIGEIEHEKNVFYNL
jgi:hypothetical protein